jgi:hypothetical protein
MLVFTFSRAILLLYCIVEMEAAAAQDSNRYASLTSSSAETAADPAEARLRKVG